MIETTIHCASMHNITECEGCLGQCFNLKDGLVGDVSVVLIMLLHKDFVHEHPSEQYMHRVFVENLEKHSDLC